MRNAVEHRIASSFASILAAPLRGQFFKFNAKSLCDADRAIGAGRRTRMGVNDSRMGTPGALYLPITGCSSLLHPLPLRTFCSQLTNWPMVLSGAAARWRACAWLANSSALNWPMNSAKCLRHLRRMRVAIARVLPLRSGERSAGHPVLRELAPHMRHVGGEVDVAAIFASIDVRSGAAVSLGAGPPLQAVLPRIARNGAAVGEGQRLLKRHVDPLPGAGDASMAHARQAQASPPWSRPSDRRDGSAPCSGLWCRLPGRKESRPSHWRWRRCLCNDDRGRCGQMA